jgi:hypothetical protein
LASLCVLAIPFILGNAFFIWLRKIRSKNRRESDEIREPVALKFVLGLVSIFLFIVYVSGGALFFRNQGYEYAKSLREFPVFELSSPNSEVPARRNKVAVIRTYGEYLYGVPIMRNTNEKFTFEKKLVIMKVSDIKSPLSLEMIGPLETEKSVETKPAP